MAIAQVARDYVSWARAAVLTMVVGCAAAQPNTTTAARFDNPARRPDLPAITVLAPADVRLAAVVEQLRHELSEDFDIIVTTLTADAEAVSRVEQALTRDQPKAVVLLNNSAARSYRRWARTQSTLPVSIILMASFAEQLQRTIPNSVGIAYEVPAVTSFVGLRSLGHPVNRVGVVHRKALSGYVLAQQHLAALERIDFVREELDDGFELRDVKAALVRLKRSGVDALWLPNDNALLTRRLLASAWLPYLERLRLPVVVGVPSLVSADHALGFFGAIPDPEALAIQAADLILDLSDDDWALPPTGVRLPLSAKTYVSAPLGQRFGIQSARLQNVDVIVGRARGSR